MNSILQCTFGLYRQRSENEIQWKCSWDILKERIALHSSPKFPEIHYSEVICPANHRIIKSIGVSKEDIMRMALQTGANTSELVEKMMERNPYVQQGFKSALGVIALEKNHYGKEVLENACKELKDLKCTYQSVRAYLERNVLMTQIIRGRAKWWTTYSPW